MGRKAEAKGYNIRIGHEPGSERQRRGERPLHPVLFKIGSHVIDTDLSALGKLLTILGGMKAGETLVGADYRTRPDFWKGFDDA